MATLTFKGKPVQTVGELPPVGSQAPDFLLLSAELKTVSLKDFAGKKKILNIVPSLDTTVCACSARRLNKEVANRKNVVLVNISADLPFASKRFCDSESLAAVVPLSTFRSSDFGRRYGVEISSGPMAGLMSRAIVVLDEQDKVLYTEQVKEIAEEPDYDAALKAIQ